MKTTAISINYELLSVSKHFKGRGIIHISLQAYMLVFGQTYACRWELFIEGIIFVVGNNKEMHLSPTKKHGIHRVISGDYFWQLSVLVSFPKILQYDKDYMSKDRVLGTEV